MPIITWNDTLSVGIKEFDDHHKKLIQLINDLHDAMRTGTSKTKMGSILEELVSYTRYHFAAEEKMFVKYGYPESISHKKQHSDMTQQVVELAQKYTKGDMSLSINLMKFLRDWLTTHINDTDKKYSAYLNEKGVH